MIANILYIGKDDPATTSGQRAGALRRLGYRVIILNLDPVFKRSIYSKISYITGYRFSQKVLLSAVQNFLGMLSETIDLVWIDDAQYIGPNIVLWLKKFLSAPVLLYEIDDPTGKRDYTSFYSLRRSIPFYDLCVFVRKETSLEALALKAKKVLTVSRSYDERVHLVQSHMGVATHDQKQISFIGTNFKQEARDEFLYRLYKCGLPIRIYGNKWTSSRRWKDLKAIVEINHVSGNYYSQIIQSSVACLGFLSHNNRDIVTTRSFEIPASNGLFCGERTSEHELLYENMKEAVLWSDIDECKQSLDYLLVHPDIRNDICQAGHVHIKNMGLGNEDICRYIISFCVTMI